jgi:hypothetical protein
MHVPHGEKDLGQVVTLIVGKMFRASLQGIGNGGDTTISYFVSFGRCEPCRQVNVGRKRADAID